MSHSRICRWAVCRQKAARRPTLRSHRPPRFVARVWPQVSLTLPGARPQAGPTSSQRISRFASAPSPLRTGPARIPPAITEGGGAVCGSGPIHFVTHRGFQPPKMRHKPVGDNSKQPIFSVACRLMVAVVHICIRICSDASQLPKTGTAPKPRSAAHINLDTLVQIWHPIAEGASQEQP